jgi:protein subunit release factor A
MEVLQMKRIVEIRPAEGGEDAQMFAGDLAVAFEKLCLRQR